jgi:putative ABC transport system permease protein
MLKNYFLVALRNFWRNKTFSLINILGLSIGISASLVIFLLVQYDFSFDKFEADASSTYRIVGDYKNPKTTYHGGCLPEPWGDAVKKEVTGVELVVPLRTLDETRVTIPYPDASHPLSLHKQKDLAVADANYFKLIGYTWLAGSPATAVAQPYQVVLTEKNAHHYYHGIAYADIIGKPIILDDTIHATITGIVKDLPGNTEFYFGAFLSRPTYYTARLKPESFGSWYSVNSADQLFVELEPQQTPASVDAQLTKIQLAHFKPEPGSDNKMIAHLQPL